MSQTQRLLLANRGQGRNISVGRSASTAVAGDERFVAGGLTFEIDVDIFVVRGGKVPDLPGDVGPAGAGSPRENVRQIQAFFGGDFFDRIQRAEQF